MIRAKIGYMFFCPVSKEIAAKKNIGITKLSAITKVETENTKILTDVKTGMEFLYGAGAKFPASRYLLPEQKFTLPDFELNDCHILLSIFEDAGVIEVAVNYSIEVDDAEKLIYLRQAFGGGAGFCNGNNVSETANTVLSCFGCSVKNAQIAFIAEINDYHGISLPEKVISNHSNEIYGIMTGDEGYEYVSDALVRDRLSHRWSTRDFVSAVVFRNNFLLFNFDTGDRMQKYREHQGSFGTEYYGAPNPYFFLDTLNAGVNHGLLFACENGMVAKTISANILSMHVAHTKNGMKLKKEIRRIKELRHELILTMNRLEEIDVAEIGELDRMVMEDLDIEPLVEKIKYLLELLESELDLLYQNSTNRFVNILTVLGLLFALVQILQGVLPL